MLKTSLHVCCLLAVAAVLAPLAGNAVTKKAAAPPTAATKRAAPAYRTVVIERVGHVRQKPDFCGEACVEMVLKKLGKAGDQDYVFDQSGLDPLLGRGCYSRDLKPALERIGFLPGPVFYQVSAANAAREMEEQFRAMHADLAAGTPSIICMHYDDRPDTTEHFRLILGYDAKTDEVLYHEPAVAAGAYRRMKREKLLKLWPLKYDARRWTVVRFRLKPGRIAGGRTASGFTDADYAQHVMRLKKKTPKGFTIVLQRPFVVIGDESPSMVRRRAVGTVKWAVDRLRRDFFAKDPRKILDIWLFKDKESYRKHTKEIFDDEPTTPFGYFSSAQGALVMNIDTGGGTLVHELVHPFIASNFPECPAWLNEGLGSLYEQCGDNRGHIWGYTNWRLRHLQTAVKEKEVPSFQTLCTTTTKEFYHEDPGTNYAQARYLCYYLQQRGLLVKFYHEFRRNVKDDPSGYKTLRRVLGRPDMDKFKREWEAYVLKLRFP